MAEDVDYYEDVEYLDQDVDYIGFIQSQLRGLQGISTLVYELLQNADDVLDDEGKPAASLICFDVRDDALIVENDGVFREIDFHRMSHIAYGGKRSESGTTGAFGIGFISVYQITDYPEILSSGRSWKICPDKPSGRRIEQRRRSTEGTVFRLPWAFEVTPVREQLRIQTVCSEQLDDFTFEIDKALRLAALFLKQIKRIQLKRNGRIIRGIERQVNKDRLLLIDGGEKTEWQIIEGNFKEEAEVLRQQYNFLIEAKRESSFRLAIPNHPLEAGTLFAILPTEDQVPLPFHLSADFFPSPDRKRILFDQDYQSAWNRAAVRAAAQTLVNYFDRISHLFKPKDLWSFIAKIQECSRDGNVEPVFQEFWLRLKIILPYKQIALTTAGKMVVTNAARFLDREEEFTATEIFECLELHIVHADLRPYYSILLELGTPRLKISDIVSAIRKKGLVYPRSLSDHPAPLNDQESWLAFWKAINIIWETRTSLIEKPALAKELSQCAIAFGIDGNLWPPKDLYKGDALAKSIFVRLKWFNDISPDSDVIPRDFIIYFTPSFAIDHLYSISAAAIENDWKYGRLNLSKLYSWLEQHRSEFMAKPWLVDKLRQLQIWPANGKLQSLEGLYLAGGFEDPLNLATLVDVRELGGRSDFLAIDLRVKKLNFVTYVLDWVPKIAGEPDRFSKHARRALIQLLALNLGQIRDNPEIHAMLKKLPVVECMDNSFSSANQVYFKSEIITILGTEVKIALVHHENSASVEALYEWLGISREPRHADILKRIKQLTTELPTPESRLAVEKIFRYLAKQWGNWSEDQRIFFNELKRLRWLPGTHNPGQWHSPDVLYSIFRDYLFRTEGNFLDIPRSIQSEASDFFKYLGVKQEPLPIFVVKHLLTCCDKQEPVNPEVYTFLNENSNDPALNDLNGKPCILISDGDRAFYVRPDQVYWNDHPFYPFRYRLDQEYLKHSALLQRLGVKDGPDEDDFIQILLDVSKQNGSSNRVLDNQAYAVVISCWKALTSAYEEERISQEIFIQKLSKQKVVPDPRKILALPERIFFEDRAGLAMKFQDLLKNDVIQRMEGAWFAMSLAGVKPLSRAISIDLTTCEDPIEDNFLAQRVKERRVLIQRVVDAEKTVNGEYINSAILDKIDFRKVRDLEVSYTLRAFNRTITIDPEPANAVFQEETLFTLHRNGILNWASVSREIASAIKPVGEIGSLAGNIKDVLSSQSFEEANNSLDELGFPPLQSNTLYPLLVHSFSISGNEKQIGNDPLSQIMGGVIPDRSPMPDQPPETSGILQAPTGFRTRSRISQKHRKSSRILSYVNPEDDSSITSNRLDSSQRLSNVEKIGIQKVIEYEALYHRTAIDMNSIQINHPGYDLESTDEQGNIRYIEVKALSGLWEGPNPAKMTKTEFNKAREMGDTYWLYIVEYAESEEAEIYCIQNPANRAGYYLYDHRWMPLAVEG